MKNTKTQESFSISTWLMKTKQNKTKQNNPVITDLAEIFEEMVLIGLYTIH